MIRFAPDLSIVGAPSSSIPMSQSSGQAVTKYSEKSTKFRWKSDKDLTAAVGAYLRGLYPGKTAQFVAADLGCSPTTIVPYLNGQSGPGLPMLAKMLDRYGPEFAAAVFGLDWLESAARSKQLADAKAEKAAAEARIARLSA